MARRVLIVDDDWAILELLKFTLERAGYEVDVAQNGQEFREKAVASRWDLIILDLMLGDEDGARIHDELVKKGYDESVPVVYLSALAQDISPTPPRPGRHFALLAKPFDPDKLVQEIAAIVPPQGH